MKRLLSLTLTLTLTLSQGHAHADQVVLTWANPTDTFTMTPAGPYTNPAGTKIYMEVADISDPAAETYTLTAVTPGTYRYVAVSYNADGVASPVSNVTEKVVTSFVAAPDTPVYQPVSISSGFWLIPMGTVTAVTDCDVSQQVNGYYRVPIEAVTWNPGVDARPVLVVAECT